MIAGFGGDLISHAYLEAGGLEDRDRDRRGVFERDLVRWWRHVTRALGPASSARAVLDVAVAPLLRLLDHELPSMTPSPYGLHGRLRSADGVLLVLPWICRPASAWRDAVNSGIAGGATWAVIVNGHSLRIVDCVRPWTRAAIDFDFERLLVSPRGVAALWTLANATAMRDRLRSQVIDSDAHASRVCQSLSDGVVAALPKLASSLAAGRTARVGHAAAFEQSLTLVYRILFLLFAEARAAVPVWNEVYRNAYTIEALADRATRSPAPGLWAALQAISRLAHAGCKAGDLDVTAFNGRLFSPRQTPLVEQRRVPDEIIRDVLLSLATETTKQGRRRISYHDLGVEQLGSVYERVLEYEPAADRNSIALTRTSTRRKSTGSFYTPRALTEFLVRRTLEPLVDAKTAAQILTLRIVDPAMGSGAFLVAACRYLSDCCERAMIRDGEWLGVDLTPANRATLRRSVAERCLYGVDLNPTAVQLARLSLWLTTLAADRPLTFLDHHLASGNSLVGARLADLSQPSRTVRTPARPAPLPLFDDLIAGDVAAQVLPARWRLAMEPSESLEVVKSKEAALSQLSRTDGPVARWAAAADAWCAARLWPGAPPSPGLVTEWIAAAIGLPTSLPAAQLHSSLARARDVAASHGAFHWELAFPEVFFDEGGRPAADGGFDAVIGNPPWDMLRADTGSSSERSDARASTTALLRFCRSSQYRQQGSGHPNSYQLFIERALQISKPGGRIGLILPSGIATDHGSAALRRHLFDRTTIDTWLGFDNRARIFPIHRSMRFVVLASTNAGRTDTLRFRCGLTDPDTIDREDARPLAIARTRLEAWSADHLTIPEITGAAALGILTTIADRIPALSDPRGWNIRFGRELNATDDRPHFERLGRHHGRLLPVVEGKQLAPFHVDITRSEFGVPIKTAARLLDRTASFDRDRIAYRDVAGATNKLTLIAAMLPRGTVSTHTVFCLKSPLDQRHQWCLLALMNSLIANYLVRLQVTTHVTTALMARLPVPRPASTSPHFARLAELSRRLASTGITEDSDDYAELNAIAAQSYGISIDDYAYILDTFPLISRSQRDLCLQQHSRKHGTTEPQGP